MITILAILLATTPVATYLSRWPAEIYSRVPSWSNTEVSYEIVVERDCAVRTTVRVRTDVDLYYISAFGAKSDLPVEWVDGRRCELRRGDPSISCWLVDVADVDRNGIDDWDGSIRAAVVSMREVIVSWRVRAEGFTLGELHLGSTAETNYESERPFRPFSAVASTDGIVHIPVPFVPRSERDLPRWRRELLRSNEEVRELNRRIRECLSAP